MAASQSQFLEETAAPGYGLAARVLRAVETVLGTLAALILAVLLAVVLVSVQEEKSTISTRRPPGGIKIL